MTNTYNVTINGRAMTKPKPNIYIPAGNINVDVIAFDINGAEWTELQKVAVFVSENKHIKVQLDEDNKAVIPPEILSKKGLFSFGLWATSIDEAGNIQFRFSTNLVTGIVGEGACGNDFAEAEKQQASAYEKLIYLTIEAANSAKASEKNARISAEAAAISVTTTKENADRTSELKKITEEKAQMSIKASEEASLSAKQAFESSNTAKASETMAKEYAENASGSAASSASNAQTAVNAADSASENAVKVQQNTDKVTELSESVAVNTESVANNTQIVIAKTNETVENAKKAEEAAEQAAKKADKNTVANALKGNAKGEAVCMADISPIEHELSVKVSGVEDITKVNVSKCGKNLFDVSKVIGRNVTGISSRWLTNNGDGSITVSIGSQTSMSGAEPHTLKDYAPNLKVGETYRLSADTTVETKKYIYLTQCSKSWMFGNALTITEEMLNSRVNWYADSSVDDGIATISNIQIELHTQGATATDFEPYIEPQTFPVNADGTVEGITSRYPSTTLTTDTVGAVIDVEYNRDLNKAFAEITQALISMGGNI